VVFLFVPPSYYNFRYNNTAEAIKHSCSYTQCTALIFTMDHYVLVRVPALTLYVFLYSLHSHCTCPYIHCTPTARVLIFTAPTERPVCVCPLDLRTRWTLAVNTCCRCGRAVKARERVTKTRDEDVKSREEDGMSRGEDSRWRLVAVSAGLCDLTPLNVSLFLWSLTKILLLWRCCWDCVGYLGRVG
jgi:hypothetical protein